jgi:hypothetical protein
MKTKEKNMKNIPFAAAILVAVLAFLALPRDMIGSCV